MGSIFWLEINYPTNWGNISQRLWERMRIIKMQNLKSYTYDGHILAIVIKPYSLLKNKRIMKWLNNNLVSFFTSRMSERSGVIMIYSQQSIILTVKKSNICSLISFAKGRRWHKVNLLNVCIKIFSSAGFCAESRLKDQSVLQFTHWWREYICAHNVHKYIGAIWNATELDQDLNSGHWSHF